MKASVEVHGIPLSEYRDHEIAHAMAKETQEELSSKEEEAADAATD